MARSIKKACMNGEIYNPQHLVLALWVHNPASVSVYVLQLSDLSLHPNNNLLSSPKSDQSSFPTHPAVQTPSLRSVLGQQSRPPSSRPKHSSTGHPLPPLLVNQRLNPWREPSIRRWVPHPASVHLPLCAFSHVGLGRSGDPRVPCC